MTKQDLKNLMDAMASTPTVEKMTEVGAAMSTYLIQHPEDTAEVMDWFSAAQQGMMSAVSETSAPAEGKNENNNFQYVFVPKSGVETEFAEQFTWTYNVLCEEIENLKADETKLTGLLLHTSGEPGFFDIQGWEMEAGGEYADELFMRDLEDDNDGDDEDIDDEDYDEESDEGDDYDEEKEIQLFEAKIDIIGLAISRIHKEGKLADIISEYPFTIYIEVHDDGADTEFLIINNEQGAKPSGNEISEALQGSTKRRTAEDFYNDILSGK